MCSGLYSRIHLSIHRLYCVYKSCLHSMYSLCGRKVPIGCLYHVSEYGLSFLRGWIHLQYGHKRSHMYSLYDLHRW